MCVAAAIAGSAVVGGIVQSDASRRAAHTSADAANANLAFQGRMFNETKAQAQPFITAGQGAYQALLKTYGLDMNGKPISTDYSGFYNAPDYKFAFQQGQQALDRSAASKGRLYSGAQLKAAQGFGQGLATQYLGNYRSGLQNASNTGTNALSTLTGARAGYSQQAGQAYGDIGNAGAAGAIGQGNAISNALGGIAYGVGYGFGGQPSTYSGGSSPSSIPSVSGNYDWYKPPGGMNG